MEKLTENNGTALQTVEEQLFVNKIMMCMAASLTKEVSSFSSWMIAGAAAFYAVVINSFDQISDHLVPGAFSGSIKIFLVAAALNVIQRLVGSMVGSGYATHVEVGRLPPPTNMNVPAFLKALENVAWYPARWMVQRSYRKLQSGDLFSSGRQHVYLAQLQAWLVFIQIILIVISGWRLIR